MDPATGMQTGIHSNKANPMISPSSSFIVRHVGPDESDVETMLARVNSASLEALVEEALPDSIKAERPLELPIPLSEAEIQSRLLQMADGNRMMKCFIGQGFHPCHTPSVIRRNILENPCWYTQYTPYQAEIAQGRLEVLLNFQTLIADLTGLPIASASLLDEASAAAEAMSLCLRARPRRSKATRFLMADTCHPQTLAVVKTRAQSAGIEAIQVPLCEMDFDEDVFGVLIQSPDTNGQVVDLEPLIERAHAAGARVAIATDPLALTLFRPPGELGADIAVGTTQRLGMGMGLGGPHAAFMSTKEDLQRIIPGRIVGVSKDSHGRTAFRLTLQTREQHIRREKATSNICTAQVLPAIVAALYGSYHGPEGLHAIALRITEQAETLRSSLARTGCTVAEGPIFDTVKVIAAPQAPLQRIWEQAQAQAVSLRRYEDGGLGISLNETTTSEDIRMLAELFGAASEFLTGDPSAIPLHMARTTSYLNHPVFHRHRSETAMLRYVVKLQKRDLSLADAMIPLGSCTMKLNPTTALEPITWPGFANIHPFEAAHNIQGYIQLTEELKGWLAEITGLPGVSLQPNAGSQGEYAGLLTIRSYLDSLGQTERNVCLIPSSAHGTNPASAQMAGFKVVVVACDDQGNVDIKDLEAKVEAHARHLAAFMITYPSTHGVFEDGILAMTSLIHRHGGQVYVDGANMNAMVGLSSPAQVGGDVCHLNLHKTFCIPHGGGGPGMGPICVASHLTPHLPQDPVLPWDGQSCGSVTATLHGSGSILPISHAYIAMMGPRGLTHATRLAILNANYIAERLDEFYPVLYRGTHGRVAHECIIDLGWLKPLGLTVDDVAKRLIDYGFHAPTVSWPVPFTMMIEPTESEDLQEIDRFCDAMIGIWHEIQGVAQGAVQPEDSIVRLAPFTAEALMAEDWDYAFTREAAAFPTHWQKSNKFWPAVGRIDNVWGDRNLFCVCPPLESYENGE